MIDHVILTVSDMDRSIEFYNQALKPLGLSHLIDFDGSTGPEGHPDLKGFGKDHTYPLWLRAGVSAGRAAHVGFTAPPPKRPSTRRTPPLWQPARPTTAHPRIGSTTVPDTTRPLSWIPTDTASSSPTKNGSTRPVAESTTSDDNQDDRCHDRRDQLRMQRIPEGVQRREHRRPSAPERSEDKRADERRPPLIGIIQHGCPRSA